MIFYEKIFNMNPSNRAKFELYKQYCIEQYIQYIVIDYTDQNVNEAWTFVYFKNVYSKN